MAENVTLAPVSSFTNDSSAVATVNANNTLITTALADCVSLAGTQPNQMQSNLDMGQFQIINLPPPNNLSSPVRLTDLANVTNSVPITVNTLPAGGSTNAVLHKNSGTDYDATWTLTPSGLTSIGATSSTVTTSNITGTAVLSGATSGTTTVQATAVASGTLTLPAATDTLIGKATTDTLINKTFDTAGTGNVFKAGGVTTSTSTGTGAIVLGTSPTITTPGIVGVTNASSATAGNVGEYVESIVAAGSAASTSTNGTVQNITSISLTAGDWDVSGEVSYISASTTNVFHAAQVSISTTSATHNLVSTAFTNHSFGSLTVIALDNPYSASGVETLRVGSYRINVNAPTTVYLVSTLNWVTSTQPTAYGTIRARRVR